MGIVLKKIKEKVIYIIHDESGMGVIEVVLIILVLVGLALVFKRQISGIANSVYLSIKTQIESF
ncbi:Flp1 family type IVb pilin [uncultured Eubacterium sp.]|uniref:Flp1 family type IVb pilin n=1 Tax=uncultured Eubacterium sp. TaxID=165185 RepID=UPI0026729154|nr:Flp1 family type IVb pilin [uncultured Eubacterium sp.]